MSVGRGAYVFGDIHCSVCGAAMAHSTTDGVCSVPCLHVSLWRVVESFDANTRPDVMGPIFEELLEEVALRR